MYYFFFPDKVPFHLNGFANARNSDVFKVSIHSVKIGVLFGN